MKKILFSLLACSILVFPLMSQNVGIGIAAPAEKLHVAGSIRSDDLASTDVNVVLSDFNGTLNNLGPGSSNQYLRSNGPGVAPSWSNISGSGIIETYAVSASRTYIPGASYVQVTGLTRTITLTGNALVHISTYGSLETDSAPFGGGSGCTLQAFLNGAVIPNAFQTVDVNDVSGIVNTIQPWSFNSNASSELNQFLKLLFSLLNFSQRGTLG